MRSNYEEEWAKDNCYQRTTYSPPSDVLGKQILIENNIREFEEFGFFLPKLFWIPEAIDQVNSSSSFTHWGMSDWLSDRQTDRWMDRGKNLINSWVMSFCVHYDQLFENISPRNSRTMSEFCVEWFSDHTYWRFRTAARRAHLVILYVFISLPALLITNYILDFDGFVDLNVDCCLMRAWSSCTILFYCAFFDLLTDFRKTFRASYPWIVSRSNGLFCT